jgi:hypothetical protein
VPGNGPVDETSKEEESRQCVDFPVCIKRKKISSNILHLQQQQQQQQINCL